jgi:tRNA wybutosine-synthesizing protein 1
LEEAQNPTQFAISLIGEPTFYPRLADLIKLLRKKKISTFLVTNGLHLSRLAELEKKKALPTQLYVSLNSPNEKLYEKWHKSRIKGAWEIFNKTLGLLPNLPTRKVVRITLVRNLNMIEPENYAKLILKAKPDFIEVKSYMAVGYARKRLGYEKMPSHSEIKEFEELLLQHLPEYKYLDEQERSRVVLLGRCKRGVKIKESEI